MFLGLQRLRAQSPEPFAQVARALDVKVEELLAVCRSIETRLRESGDTEAADVLGVVVLEWETALDVPALAFPFLLQDDSRN